MGLQFDKCPRALKAGMSPGKNMNPKKRETSKPFANLLDARCVCLALEVLLPALVMLVMMREWGRWMMRMRVRAGREAARAG